MNARQQFEEVFGLISDGRIDDAEIRCRKFLEGSSNDVNLLGLLGAILVKKSPGRRPKGA